MHRVVAHRRLLVVLALGRDSDDLSLPQTSSMILSAAFSAAAAGKYTLIVTQADRARQHAISFNEAWRSIVGSFATSVNATAIRPHCTVGPPDFVAAINCCTSRGQSTRRELPMTSMRGRPFPFTR